jgi:putative DNA primase/helicase
LNPSGQQIRVVDVPADTWVHGLFENLHGFPDARAFADHLVEASSQFYGTAARAFIEKIADQLGELGDTVAEDISRFISDNCPGGSHGQVQRESRRVSA